MLPHHPMPNKRLEKEWIALRSKIAAWRERSLALGEQPGRKPLHNPAGSRKEPLFPRDCCTSWSVLPLPAETFANPLSP